MLKKLKKDFISKSTILKPHHVYRKSKRKLLKKSKTTQKLIKKKNEMMFKLPLKKKQF